MSTRGNLARPWWRPKVVAATVTGAAVVVSMLAIGTASGALSGQHRSGDSAAARSATSFATLSRRAVGRASLVSPSAQRSLSHPGLSLLPGFTSLGAPLASTGCGASGTIADQTGFEGADGNLAVDNAGCKDWNSFSPLTWNGTAPYQTASASIGGGAFKVFGATDGCGSSPCGGGNDTSYSGGVKQADACPGTTTGPVDNKADLARVYVAGTLGSNGDEYLDLAWVREPQNTTSSDVHVGFEFNQGTAACTNGDGFVQRTKGDILLVYNFQSGSASIAMATWTGSAWTTEMTLSSTVAEAKVFGGSGSTTDALKPTGAPNPATDEFGEAGIDLTAATANLSSISGRACEKFGAVFGESRTSGSSTSAQMEDVVGPANIDLSNCDTPTVDTTLRNAAGNAVIADNSQVDLGTSVYDTATLGHLVAGKVPTGTVTYTFFANGACSGTGTPAGTVTLDASGGAPKSNPEGPLTPGDYSFQAQYDSGKDPNYNNSDPSGCEPFTVKQGTSSTGTVVFDASTNKAWSGLESTGASAFDTSSVRASAGFTATGTVSYSFFSNGSCQGTGAGAGTVTLDASGNVPKSSTEGPLTAGSYSFQATYSGDDNYAGSTGPCESFTVNQGSSSTGTVVFDAGTKLPWSGLESTGASAYDTSSVTPSAGFTATGTVSYAFFSNGSCQGTGAGAGTVTLDASGNVPKSSTEGPLAAGSYSFQATYSGDDNYAGSTGPCESFTVNQGSSSTGTVVFDAGTNAAWAGTESTGASAYDTSSVTPSAGFTATGTVSYAFFSNGSCQGTGAAAGTVTLDSSGNAPNSSTEGPLAAGSYSFQATYSGDDNYAGSTGPCEPLSVGVPPTKTSTTVFDAVTNAAWSATETTGASAYDTASVSGAQGGIVPSGTVTYTFFANGGCSGSGTPAGTVTLDAAGNVPNSNSEGPPLGAGSYSFQAVYSGDANYATSTGPCEPFTVNQGSSKTATSVFDSTTNALWSGTESTGASAYDTSSVTPSDGITATGTVSYTFFSNGSCQGTGAAAGTVTLDAFGNVPNSDPEKTLAQGSYSFQAVYSGDGNYAGSTGPCEPFTVNQGTSSTATIVFDAGTNAPWSGSEAAGASAYDTSSVTPSDGITATGTVSYRFFSNGSCQGTGAAAGTVTLDASGNVPNSSTEASLAAGSYSFQATYGGDGNYAGSTGPCEQFAVAKVSPSVSTVASPSSATVGSVPLQTASDTATFTGGFQLTGQSVDFTLYSGPSCAAASATSVAGPATIDGQGQATFSGDASSLAAGTYYWGVSYGGDQSNRAVSECGGAKGVQNETLVIHAPGIHIVKEADAPQVNAGQPIGFTLTVYNDGSGDALGVQLSDTLPVKAGLSWSIASQGIGWGSSCSIASGVLSCGGSSGVTVPAGTSKAASTFTVHITSPTTAATGGNCPGGSGVIPNTGNVTTSNGGSGQSSASTCVAAPTIHIAKTADAPQVSAGDPIGFTLTVWNPASGDAHGVVLTDTLPSKAGLNWSIDNAGSGFGSSCSISSGVLTCGPVTVPALTTKAATTFTVHITSPTTAATGGGCPGGSGVVTNTGSVTTTNDGSGSSTASTCVAAPSIHIVKTADEKQVNAGDPIGFTLTVWNSGSGDAKGVVLTDTLPTKAGLNWSIDNTGSGFGSSCSIVAGVLTCGPVTVPSGGAQASSTFTVHVTSPTTAATGGGCPGGSGVVTNTGSVTTTNDGSGSSTASTCVAAPAIHIVKTADAAQVNVGQDIGFTMTVYNLGSGDAYGVKLNDPLPTNPGLDWSVDTTGAGWGSSCAINSGTLTCGGSSGVTVPAGTTKSDSSFTVHITSSTTATTGGDCPNTGVVNNTGSVSTTNDGSDQSTASTCVQAMADLAITKDGTPANGHLPENITWTMVVTNNGPNSDTGVQIQDPMPAGNAYVSATSTQGTCTGGAILNCDIGDMAADASVTITLVTTPSAPGTQTNTVVVSGDRPESDYANNTATASVVVQAPFKIYCVAVSRITPKQLFVGRKATLTIHVTQHRKAKKGIRVRIRGKKFNVLTKRSNAKGIIKRVVKMKRAGILTFTPLTNGGETRCVSRIGVTGVFTPPVTG